MSDDCAKSYELKWVQEQVWELQRLVETLERRIETLEQQKDTEK
jgi:ubiquinone biosynthesis protein UbiJ